MLIAKMAVVEDVRSAERIAVSEETTIRVDDRPVAVEVFNLSETGCLIRSPLSLTAGMDIKIGLPGAGSFLAQVVRTQGSEAGCQFAHPLSARQLDAAFRSDVVVDAGWANMRLPTPLDRGTPETKLSSRTRLLLITGISLVLWAAIAASAAAVIAL